MALLWKGAMLYETESAQISTAGCASQFSGPAGARFPHAGRRGSAGFSVRYHPSCAFNRRSRSGKALLASGLYSGLGPVVRSPRLSSRRLPCAVFRVRPSLKGPAFSFSRRTTVFRPNSGYMRQRFSFNRKRRDCFASVQNRNPSGGTGFYRRHRAGICRQANVKKHVAV